MSEMEALGILISKWGSSQTFFLIFQNCYREKIKKKEIKWGSNQTFFIFQNCYLEKIKKNKKIINAIRMLIASTWNIVFFHLNDDSVSVDGKFPAYVAAVGFLVLLRI